MSCDHFEELIPSYVEGTLQQTRELEAHLINCPSCREKEVDVRRALVLMHQWKEESVPAWNRAPIGFFNPKRPHWLWRWGPLLVAVVLFGFVLFHLEIKVHDTGTTIRFSSTQEQDEVVQELVSKMEERDKAYRASFEDLLETYQSQQEKQVERIVETALKSNNQDLNKSLRILNDNWKTQREADNQYFNRQIQNVKQHATQNFDNLNYLANHIVRNDRRSP